MYRAGFSTFFSSKKKGIEELVPLFWLIKYSFPHAWPAEAAEGWVKGI